MANAHNTLNRSLATIADAEGERGNLCERDNGSAHAVVIAGCCLADCKLSSVLNTQTCLLSCSLLSTALLTCFPLAGFICDVREAEQEN